MSEQRDRLAVLDEDDDFQPAAWNYRAIAGSSKGIPWWGAILCALIPALISAYIDISSNKTVGWVFNVAFFIGALTGILMVQRRSLFAPMVQPPLILAVTVPTLVLLTGSVQKGGLAAMALNLGKPLIDSFLVMAITTAVAVALGVVRMFIEKDPNRPSKDEVREARAEIKNRRRPAPEDRPRREPAEERPRREAASEDRPRGPRPEGAPARRPRPEGAPARRPRPEGAARGERPAAPRRPRPPRDDR